MSGKGFFITMEGIDGCGKTLAAEKLCAYLTEEGFSVVRTFEPGGSDLGAEIRAVLLNSDKQLDPRAELLLFAADRAQHMARVVRPALENGKIVVSDRFTDSTLAYQGGGRGLPLSLLSQVNKLASFELVPDVTFYLSVPLDIAQRRRSLAPDRMEKEDMEFHNRVLQAYEQLAVENVQRIVKIDASVSAEEVFNQIKYIIEQRRRGGSLV